jgi:hypothetical protein
MVMATSPFVDDSVKGPAEDTPKNVTGKLTHGRTKSKAFIPGLAPCAQNVAQHPCWRL